MDLVFRENRVEYLRRVMCKVVNQEETAELLLPESYPDAARIIGCWGIPVLRGKDWRSDTMTASGGIAARVLYIPADDSVPRVLDGYLPFNARWEYPDQDKEGPMRVDCRLRSIDARMVNARKILLRANLASCGEVYTPQEETFYTFPQAPKNVELNIAHYKMTLPSACSEKTFLIDEELELPDAAAELEQVVYYSLQPELTDQKVLGSKAVFKGTANLHLVYLTPEGRIATWEYGIPFSQYAELDREFELEEELQISLMPTGIEVEANGETGRVRVKCSMLAQCLVSEARSVEAVLDAYSPVCSLESRTKTANLNARLDRQQMQQSLRQSVALEGNVVDVFCQADYPRQGRSGDQLRLEVPAHGQILYYDAQGELQGKSFHGQTDFEMCLDDSGKCCCDSAIAGNPRWTGTEVQATIAVTADSFAGQGMEYLCGITLGDPLPREKQRPSVVIRRTREGETLWGLGKRYGSTVDAIRGANDLPRGEVEPGTLVLIPTV